MRRLMMALLAGMLVVAACGDDDDTVDEAGSEDSNGEESSGGEIEATATVGDDGLLEQAECTGDNVAAADHGVTEDTANISIVSIDFEPLAEIGFAASDRDPTHIFNTFVEEINDNGGVCGRTVDVQQVKFDIIAGEAGQACVEATEDRDNLLVLTQGYSENLCLTDAGLPVVGLNDVTRETMEDTEGRMLTRAPSLEQQYEATVQYAAEEGALDGTVGVWYGGIYPDQNQAVEDIVLPMLDELDVDYLEFATTASGPSDPEGNSILTAAATEFAAAEIDTLLQFVQNTNQTGMQIELDAQGVDPRYISMPVSGNTANELFAERFGTAEIADGQEWVTYTLATTEMDASVTGAEACHEIWTRRTGETVEPNTFDYSSIVGSCMNAYEVAAAMSMAGGELNRERVITAFENLPAHPVGTLLGDVEWSEDNHFGPDQFSVHTFDGDTLTVSTADERFVVE